MLWVVELNGMGLVSESPNCELELCAERLKFEAQGR